MRDQHVACTATTFTATNYPACAIAPLAPINR